jgi:lipid-binding SYLF domain-containing protein
MKALTIVPTVVLIAFAGLAPVGAQDKDAQEVATAIANFKSSDAALAKWFDTAYGYAVFPSVGKGAVVVGAASGSGRVFEKGTYIGDVHMTQATVGAQIGGEAYAEVIFFETKAALDRFKENRFEMSAGLNAVAADSGKSMDAKYAEGVAVFTQAKKGLMAEASVGGQKFKFTPKK